MMPRFLARACALMLLGCASAVPAAPAGDAAGEAFAAGRRAFEAGDWQAALTAFQAARDAGMQGAAIGYNIGVCQYRLGAYREAERTFLEVAGSHPAMAPLAWYNAGLAVYRQQDPRRAAAFFERAKAAEDPKIARLAARMLDRLTPARAVSAPGTWIGFVELAAGFDDNVALVEDASLPAGESTDSSFVGFFGQLGRAAPGGGFGGSASAYLVRYPDAGDFDQDIVQLAGTWGGDLGGWRVTAGPHVSFSTLDGDSFERRLGASLTLDRPLGDATRLTASALFESVDELDARFAFVDGSRGLLELELERRAGAGSLALEYAFSVDNRAEASVSPTRHQLTLRWDQALADGWSFKAGAGYRASRYADLSPPRDEDRRELALALSRALPRNWQLTLDYRYTSNGSNAEAFDYERNRVQLGVDRVFQ